MSTKQVLPIRHNVYGGWDLGHPYAKPVARGQLEGSLNGLAVYCLIGHHGPVGRISEKRLAALFESQHCPGLLSRPSPHLLRVRTKTFRAWLLHNISRITMTKDEKEEERGRHWRALMRDYAENGPHFFDPGARARWEAAQDH